MNPSEYLDGWLRVTGSIAAQRHVTTVWNGKVYQATALVGGQVYEQGGGTNTAEARYWLAIKLGWVPPDFWNDENEGEPNDGLENESTGRD